MMIAFLVNGPCHAKVYGMVDSDPQLSFEFPIAHGAMGGFDFTDEDARAYPRLLRAVYLLVKDENRVLGLRMRYRESIPEKYRCGEVAFYEYAPPKDFLERALLKQIREAKFLRNEVDYMQQRTSILTLEHESFVLLKKIVAEWIEAKRGTGVDLVGEDLKLFQSAAVFYPYST